MSDSQPDGSATEFGDLASDIEKAAEEALGGGEAPTTDNESAADELIKLIKDEQAKIYAHDVDEDDPPERTGPYPAGGPS